MQSPLDSVKGKAVGWIAVAIGILYLGIGLAYAIRQQGPEMFGGLVFGEVAFVAGCVILHRREYLMDDRGETISVDASNAPNQ